MGPIVQESGEHEAEVPLREVADVWGDARELRGRDTEPFRERRSVLIRRKTRDHASAADVVGPVDLQQWIAPVDRPAGHCATDDELISRVAPYLSDFDENVRFVAINALASREPAKIANPLIDALVRPEEESGRIRRTVAEVLEKTKAPLGGRGKEVAAVLTGPLADDFKVDGELLKKR